MYAITAQAKCTDMPLPERRPSARSAGGTTPAGLGRAYRVRASLLHVTQDGVAGDRRLSGGHEASMSDGVPDRSLGLAHLHGHLCG